jgi:multidrug efflux system membrane fusion protein
VKFPVDVATVESRHVEYAVTAVGSIDAFERVQVTARVGGAVERVLFREGAEVTAGQLLVEIELDRYRVAVETARAALNRATTASADARGNFGAATSSPARARGSSPPRSWRVFAPRSGSPTPTWRRRARPRSSPRSTCATPGSPPPSPG